MSDTIECLGHVQQHDNGYFTLINGHEKIICYVCKASKLYLPFQKILPLSDSEKLVLSKGLNFVPISKKTDEFLVKQDVEKFLRRVQLKAFLCEKEGDSNTSN